MSLDQLRQTIASPAYPKFSPDLWLMAESRLGTTLPKELYDYSKCYGSGIFRGEVYTSLCIFNPGAPGYLDEIEFELQRMRDTKAYCDPEDFPFAVYPDRGGLLSFGVDENNIRLCWRTMGPPDRWPIIVIWQDSPDGFAEHDVPLLDFLNRLLRRELLLPCWPEPSFADDVRFEPFEPQTND